MSDDVKYCRDCKYVKPAGGILRWGAERWQYARCLHPRVSPGGCVAPGVFSHDVAYCSVERGAFGLCGQSAKLFFAKVQQ